MQHAERPPLGIVWTDLASMTPIGTIKELLLPVPWLILSFALYASAAWPLGAVASFVFFLCALRLNHEAIHGNLGLPRWADSIVLHVLSALILGSNHAVAHGHRLHHRFQMGPGDHEGHCGHMSAREVLAYGPKFPFDIMSHAWRSDAPGLRRRMEIDGVLIAGLVAGAVYANAPMVWLHLSAMATAQCLTAFFAVWITHHGVHGVAARSQRGMFARLAYLMFYHREHHLYPRVPVHRLPDLARRLDDTVPGYAEAHMPVVPFLDPNMRAQRKCG